jgi:transcriptional regulator with XRE-family HTH domain
VHAQQIGRLFRAVRRKRGLTQAEVAAKAGVSHGTVSLVERGHGRTLSLETIERLGGVLDIRLELQARWRGGDIERLLSRGHSLLAPSFAGFMASRPDWVAVAEVSFSEWGERGVVDQLAWHAATKHLLVLEFKTEFVDMNEMLGTLDRKVRLAPGLAARMGWETKLVSVWLIVVDTRTNRRHAREHAAMLRTRFRSDGRKLRSFLAEPSQATSGLAFWTGATPPPRGSSGPPSETRRASRT